MVLLSVMVSGRAGHVRPAGLPPHRYGFYVEDRACPAPTEGLLFLFVVYRRIVRFQLYDTEMVGPLGLYGIAQGIDELDAPVLFVGHVLGRDGTVKKSRSYVSGRAQCAGRGCWPAARVPRPHAAKNALSSSAWGSPVTTGSKWIVAISPSSTSRSRSIRSMISWLCMTSFLASISRWKLTRRLPGP